MSENLNFSNCPGTDVILELLRAEHDQVKQRTDIIKQLILYNCPTKSDVISANRKAKPNEVHKYQGSRPNSPEKKRLYEEMTKMNKEVDTLTKINSEPPPQLSTNNRDSSRHEKCFLPYYDTANVEKPNRVEVNAVYNRISQGSFRGSNTAKKEELHSSLPTYSMAQRDNAAKSKIPTYSQFQKEATTHSTPNSKFSKEANMKKGPKAPNKKKGFQTQNKGITNTANQTDAMMRNIETEMGPGEHYDYKFESYKLLQEVADLKMAARKYEEEKCDWIYEKRQQIRILQELRDASCDETQAAMQLTSWKPMEIECNPTEYEECKRKWLLCKKLQIELLDKLRGVSLCEIKRTIQKVSVPEVMNINCSKFEEKSKSCLEFPHISKPGTQELFNSEKFAVRICSPEDKNECFDKDKININILMRSNSNIFKMAPEVPELSMKGSPFYNFRSNFNNSGVFQGPNLAITSSSSQNLLLSSKPELDAISDSKKNDATSSVSSRDEESIDGLSIEDLKKSVENKIGRKLFQNTYNLLKQLNCPDLILKSTNGNAEVAEIVFNYIIQEKKANEKSLQI